MQGWTLVIGSDNRTHVLRGQLEEKVACDPSSSTASGNKFERRRFSLTVPDLNTSDRSKTGSSHELAPGVIERLFLGQRSETSTRWKMQ